MSVTVESSGTQTAVISTEHELAKSSLAKALVLLVDTGAMLSGDVLELRVYAILLTSGAERLQQVASYADVQAEPGKQSVPFPATGKTDGYRVTLKQTAGVGRAFPWSIVSL